LLHGLQSAAAREIDATDAMAVFDVNVRDGREDREIAEEDLPEALLEHVDEAMTMLAIARMLEASTRGVFLSISLVPDQFGILVGRPLHLTVKPFTWWRDRIRELGTIAECRDLIDAGLYLVTP
jgi:hypothetical protein